LQLFAYEHSVYNEISVYNTTQLYGEKGKFRFIQFSDQAIQGAIDLNDSKRIVLEYPRAIIHLMESNLPTFDHVFVIGHGIGTISGHFADKRFTVAEIDEKVVELSRSYFGYRKNDVMIGDGRQILQNEANHSFDYIILDAFTNKGTPFHLTSLEFFRMAGDKLSSQGSLIMNLIGKAKHDKQINAIYTTLKETFAFTKAFTLKGDNATDILNILIMGSHKLIEFHAREMAGFYEIELGQDYIRMDKASQYLKHSN
jgi:spermidine synthase